MAQFQSIVIGIAIILFVICLIMIGMLLMNSKNTQVWPPITGDCPDYWIDLSGNGGNCVNVKNLGKCNSNIGPSGHSSMDFSKTPYTGTNGTCAKYAWATACDVTWDGITYGVKNPCDSLTSEYNNS
jgi:hypothetical protein